LAKPTLEELLDFSDTKPSAGIQPATVVTTRTLEEAGNQQAFSWPWVWISLGSFVLAQFLMHGLIMRAASAHGLFLLEALIDVFTYVLGGFMVGAASPKVRVMEPAVAAVIALVLTLHVGMWMPFSFFSAGLAKTVVMSFVVAFCAYEGAVMGEKLTRQIQD
jgi:hypothetical protein